jgi:hypothetical protein
VTVERQPAEIVVGYRLEPPPPGALVAQALTQPFHLARVPRPGLPVRFQRL